LNLQGAIWMKNYCRNSRIIGKLYTYSDEP
jgi:hypothetical protein